MAWALIASIVTGSDYNSINYSEPCTKPDSQKIVPNVIRLTHFNGPVLVLIIISFLLLSAIQLQLAVIATPEEITIQYHRTVIPVIRGDYTGASNPNHQTLGFSTTCTSCHSTQPGWKPAAYTQHDSQSFPIYSGKHKGKWDSCTDCHTNSANYSQFSCLDMP
ncbi:MAG: hypothetical protein MZV64_16055 [Ignavibacteriales bacterium]|nr:hypothetical protein [Ignavibacteriales bacterium]